MPLRDDDDALKPIDDLLALDRKSIAGAANERIAGGMYARIARAHAERKLVVAGRWGWGLAAAATACLALAVIWFAEPARNGRGTNSGNPQRPQTVSAAPVPGRMDPRPAAKSAPGKKLARSAPRAHSVVAQEIAPRRARFPSNVAPTEQEVLLMQLASHHPNQLLAVAEAIADMRNREEKERQDFDQWVQKGGTQ